MKVSERVDSLRPVSYTHLDEADILGQIRALICMIPANNEDDLSYSE